MFVNQSGFAPFFSFFFCKSSFIWPIGKLDSPVTSTSLHLWPLRISPHIFCLQPHKWSVSLCPIRMAKFPFASSAIIHTYFVLFPRGCSITWVALRMGKVFWNAHRNIWQWEGGSFNSFKNSGKSAHVLRVQTILPNHKSRWEDAWQHHAWCGLRMGFVDMDGFDLPCFLGAWNKGLLWGWYSHLRHILELLGDSLPLTSLGWDWRGLSRSPLPNRLLWDTPVNLSPLAPIGAPIGGQGLYPWHHGMKHEDHQGWVKMDAAAVYWAELSTCLHLAWMFLMGPALWRMSWM